jgi:hypothetical protein
VLNPKNKWITPTVKVTKVNLALTPVTWSYTIYTRPATLISGNSGRSWRHERHDHIPIYTNTLTTLTANDINQPIGLTHELRQIATDSSSGRQWQHHFDHSTTPRMTNINGEGENSHYPARKPFVRFSLYKLGLKPAGWIGMDCHGLHSYHQINLGSFNLIWFRVAKTQIRFIWVTSNNIHILVHRSCATILFSLWLGQWGCKNH